MNSVVDLRSDNVAGVSPTILAAIAAANAGTATSYGDDEISRAVNERFSALFGTTVTVFPVSTGTAANAISLASSVRPYGGIFCHAAAHIHTSEGSAVGAFSGGASLLTLQGRGDRLDADELRRATAASGRGNTQKPQPDAISVTQATEAGTIYQLDELAAIGRCAREAGLVYHMDGARFSNALATLGCSLAAMTSAVGVDIMSFGATKNGAMNTEAIVVLNPALREPVAYRLRRAGQTWSKMRFAAAQLMAFVDDQTFIRSARSANAAARRLSAGLLAIPGVHLQSEVEANIVFPVLPPAVIDRLAADGFLFSQRTRDTIRLVCRFDLPSEAVDLFITAARAHMSAHHSGLDHAELNAALEASKKDDSGQQAGQARHQLPPDQMASTAGR